MKVTVKEAVEAEKEFRRGLLVLVDGQYGITCMTNRAPCVTYLDGDWDWWKDIKDEVTILPEGTKVELTQEK